MTNAHVLIDAGMLSPKDWIGMSIDIEQFRKAEGGSLDSSGDILANWLSESDKPEKVKREKKQKEVTQ